MHRCPTGPFPISGGSLPTVAILLALILGLPSLPGCGDDEPAKRVDLTKRMDLTVPEQSDAITYAYLPQYSHAVSYERHRLLLEYLRQATGLPLRQVFPDTFDEHIKMVQRGEIDISFSNPFVYIKLAESGAQAFARVVEPSGRPDFRGQILCRADNPNIETLADCKGKRWIAVDPKSAGGFLYPLGHFLEHGITPSEFKEITFAPGPGGKQEKVVLAVYAGTYDIGTVRDSTLNILAGKIDLGAIRVLAESRAYPGWVYAARKGLEPKVVQALSRAMLALSMENPKQADILTAAKIRGILPAKDSDYDPVRELARQVGLMPTQGLREIR